MNAKERTLTFEVGSGSVAIRAEKSQHNEGAPKGFLDAIQDGWQINLAIAIDYTSSNRNQSDPHSLHSVGSGTNSYLESIKLVGEILEPHDHDGKIPIYGFGAYPSFISTYPHNFTSHCFPLTGDFD